MMRPESLLLDTQVVMDTWENDHRTSNPYQKFVGMCEAAIGQPEVGLCCPFKFGTDPENTVVLRAHFKK